jgi:hypothetical protein
VALAVVLDKAGVVVVEAVPQVPHSVLAATILVLAVVLTEAVVEKAQLLLLAVQEALSVSSGPARLANSHQHV